MKLIYDIAVMAQLVAACESANIEIVKAEQLVQQVRSHSDWTCKEKSVIDELMQECKQLVQRMREDQSSFLRVLKDVEGELNDTENSVSNLFSGVESILGKVLGIPVAQSVAVGGGLLGVAVSGIADKVSDVINGIQEPIPVGINILDEIKPNSVGAGLTGNLLEKLKEIGEDIMDTDVIWHGPPQIGIPSNIIDGINNIGGIGTIIGSGVVKPQIIAPVADIVPDITDAIGVGLGATIGSNAIPINGVMDSIGANLGNVTEVIGNGIGNIVDGIGSGIGSVVDGIGSGLGGIAENVICGNGVSDFVDEMRESILQGRTEYGPQSQNFNLVQDALEQVQDVGKTIGSVVTDAIPVAVPVGQWISDTAGNVWNQVQDSPIGDAVQDALRQVTEVISICDMPSLKL